MIDGSTYAGREGPVNNLGIQGVFAKILAQIKVLESRLSETPKTAADGIDIFGGAIALAPRWLIWGQRTRAITFDDLLRLIEFGNEPLIEAQVNIVKLPELVPIPWIGEFDHSILFQAPSSDRRKLVVYQENLGHYLDNDDADKIPWGSTPSIRTYLVAAQRLASAKERVPYARTHLTNLKDSMDPEDYRYLFDNARRYKVRPWRT